MEQPKALLPIDGQPAALALHTRLSNAGFSPVVTVTSSEIKEALDAHAYPGQIVINDETEKGALHSFRLGLSALPDDTIAALLYPVDHPLVRPNTLKKIIDSAAIDKIIIPCFEGRRGHPTLFGRDSWSDIFALPLEEGARGVLRKRPESIQQLDVNDPGVIQNLNTPSDLTAAGLS